MSEIIPMISLGDALRDDSVDLPDLIPYSASMFPEDSLGRRHFPTLLEGRTRLNRLDEYEPDTVGIPSVIIRRDLLDGGGCMSTRAILSSTLDDFGKLTERRRAQIDATAERIARRLVNRLFHTPHTGILRYMHSGIDYGWLDVPIEEESLLAESLELVMRAKLTERNAKIMASRYGLDSWRAQTHETVGAEFGLTKARIKQIDDQSMSRLRVPTKELLPKHRISLIDRPH